MESQSMIIQYVHIHNENIEPKQEEQLQVQPHETIFETAISNIVSQITVEQTILPQISVIEIDLETEPEKKIDPAISSLANCIRRRFKDKNVNDHACRPVKMGGVIVVPVVYKNPKIINFEAQNIMVKRTYLHVSRDEPLSLCHEKYTDLIDALEKIQTIYKTYKLNPRCGEIQTPNRYTESVLEETVLPYDPDIVCAVCLEPTTDITKCNHGICLPCRDKCITTNNNKCPICRGQSLTMFDTLTFYYSNFDFPIVNKAYVNTLKVNEQKNDNNTYESSDTESEEDDSENDSTL